MELTLKINYSAIDKEARQYVEYVGSMSTEGEYQRILLQVEDASLLEELHVEMIAGLNSIMMMWSKSDVETETGRDITYLLPANAGVSVPQTVAKEADAFFVSYIVSKWFEIAGLAESADSKAEEAAAHLKAICAAMTRRLPPLRHQQPHISQHVGFVEGLDAGVLVSVTRDE